MRSIGKSAEAGRMFCGVMNLPQPPTRFSPYGKRILNAAKLVYEDSIQNAAKEAICENEGNKNIAVAVDGTWQKRGYTSLNGVVTVTSIDTGKVIDVDILSKYCACKNLPFHEKDCKRNYVGSSGAMEIQGASKIFQRSLSLHNARYITYLGDGDCKAFNASYYGSAIRRNHSSVQNMRQAIWAIFLHKLSSNEYPQHGFCPIGEDSWCGLKKAEASGKSYKHKNSLPVAVVEAMRPIFRDLSHPDLLKKCLHGKTQNPNESFHNVVWSRVPKATFVQIETLSLGVYDAVCSFNDGNVSKLKMLQKMGVEPGEFSTARGGRVRSSTPAEDRYIVLSAKRNRRITAHQVANQFLAASEKHISRKTVARRLRGGGLYARRPVVCVPLTRQHRIARLQWCRDHHNWTEQDWACVLFSDESRFSLSSDCRRQLIWRERGTAYHPENIQEKDRYLTCSIMVWAGIMINGRTRLHVVANGTMTGQRYIDEVLLPLVRLFRGAVGDKFVFTDDNATCHRTLAVQDCLDNEGNQRLVWPARSPDLNPIENVWDALGRQVAGRNYPPTNKNTLIRALTEEWDKLPQQLLDNVVQSMVRRVECCITLHGSHIPY
ncbi:transposable element Tcb2 transposase [Trichonephila clavipes]|nr:transposable element Tcb2 transposase [Trichonephila clavipes]